MYALKNPQVLDDAFKKYFYGLFGSLSFLPAYIQESSQCVTAFGIHSNSLPRKFGDFNPFKHLFFLF